MLNLLSRLTGKQSNSKTIDLSKPILIYSGTFTRLIQGLRGITLTSSIVSGPCVYAYTLSRHLALRNNDELPAWITTLYSGVDWIKLKLPDSITNIIQFNDTSAAANNLEYAHLLQPVEWSMMSVYGTTLTAMTCSFAMFGFSCWFNSNYVTRAYLNSIRSQMLPFLLQPVPANTSDPDKPMDVYDVHSHPSTANQILEEFRSIGQLDLYKSKWYGKEYMTRVRIKDLYKIDAGHNVDYPVTANLFSNSSFGPREFFYLDFDLVKGKYPKLWFALHSCIPWAADPLEPQNDSKRVNSNRSLR